MKGINLRRPQRRNVNQTDSNEINAPVQVTFRSHASSLSKAPFLYCPKNYNLPMPAMPDGFTEEVIELVMPNGVHGKNSSHANNHGVVSSNAMLQSSLGAIGAAVHNEQRFVVNNFSATSLTPSPSVVSLPSDAAPQVVPVAPAFLTESTEPESGGEVWICRAYCFGEKDAVHTNGAISVHQSVANKSPYINDIAKGKATARVIPTYAEVRERFGLSHVELAFEGFALTRADMFLISEALLDRIIYEGEEISSCGVTVKVNEQLRCAVSQSEGCSDASSSTFAPATAFPRTGNVLAMPSKATQVSSECEEALASTDKQITASPAQQRQTNDAAKGQRHLVVVRCGLVTEETLVNFRSLSPKYLIILEISKEMWNPTVDGHIVLNWAIKKFLKDYLVHQVAKHKASPIIRIAVVARLEPQYAVKGEVDLLHMIVIPSEFRLADVPDEVDLQCEIFLKRVLSEVRSEIKLRSPPIDTDILSDALTEQDIFVHAKNAGTIQALSLMLEQCVNSPNDNTPGYVMTIVSAGKGLYQVNSDLQQVTCTQIFNIGIEKVNIVCVGRPPLHETPLLEYLSDDKTLRSQYHLRFHSRNQRIYERPEWARSLFYYPPPDCPVGGALVFELLTRNEWVKRHRTTKTGTTLFDQGFGLPAAPLAPVLLPVFDPRKVGRRFASADKQAMSTTKERVAPDISSIVYSSSATQADKTLLLHSTWCNDPLHNNDAAVTSAVPPDAPFIIPMWYSRYSTAARSFSSSSDGAHVRSGVRQPRSEMYSKLFSLTDTLSDPLMTVIACGVDVLDSDVQSGKILLEMQLSAAVTPAVCWSPQLLRDASEWTKLMSAFVGRESRMSPAEQEYFAPHFRASEIFCRRCSAITEQGRTMILRSHSNNVNFVAPEEVVFTCRNMFFGYNKGDELPEIITASLDFTDNLKPLEDKTVSATRNVEKQKSTKSDEMTSEADADTQTLDSSFTNREDVDLSNQKTTVARIQIRNSLLFAIQPIDSYPAPSGLEIVDSAALNVSSSLLFRRRWFFAHPDTPASAWSALCHCKIVPLYGTNSAYPRDSFYALPPHQYAVSVKDKTHLLEFILQRLQKQYQIIVDGKSLVSLTWPRTDPAPNVRVNLSIGHQTHRIKVNETGQSISISRTMHRGMYSNASATHIITHSYLLFNYLTDGFNLKEVRLPVKIGEKFAFHWEAMDSFLCESPGALIPREPFCSLHESERGVVLLPESVDAPPVPFSEFVKFIGCRFSVHLTTREHMEWAEDYSPLSVSISDEMVFEEPPPLCRVVLSHDNPLTLDQQCVIDHKTGRTLSILAPARNRCTMAVEIALPKEYNPRCHYFLNISWIVCVETFVSDWFGCFLANAARYHFRAIPIPSYMSSSKLEKIAPSYTVHADSLKDEPQFRRRLLMRLTSRAYAYFPDIPVMNRNCRLVHISGLCYVMSPPDDRIVAQWYENPMLRMAQPEHQRLLQEFIEAVQHAREDVG